MSTELPLVRPTTDSTAVATLKVHNSSTHSSLPGTLLRRNVCVTFMLTRLQASEHDRVLPASCVAASGTSGGASATSGPSEGALPTTAPDLSLARATSEGEPALVPPAVVPSASASSGAAPSLLAPHNLSSVTYNHAEAPKGSVYATAFSGYVFGLRMALDGGGSTEEADAVRLRNASDFTEYLTHCFFCPQDGATALSKACREGHIDAVRVLVEAGARVDAVDKVMYFASRRS